MKRILSCILVVVLAVSSPLSALAKEELFSAETEMVPGEDILDDIVSAEAVEVEADYSMQNEKDDQGGESTSYNAEGLLGSGTEYTVSFTALNGEKQEYIIAAGDPMPYANDPVESYYRNGDPEDWFVDWYCEDGFYWEINGLNNGPERMIPVNKNYSFVAKWRYDYKTELYPTLRTDWYTDYQYYLSKTAIENISFQAEPYEGSDIVCQWEADKEGMGLINVFLLTGNRIVISGFGSAKITLEGGTNLDLFRGFSSVKEISGLDMLDTSDAWSFVDMFSGCEMLSEIDLSAFETSTVKYFNRMFNDCQMLESLDLSAFDMSSMTAGQNLFDGIYTLKSITSPKILPYNIPMPELASGEWPVECLEAGTGSAAISADFSDCIRVTLDFNGAEWNGKEKKTLYLNKNASDCTISYDLFSENELYNGKLPDYWQTGEKMIDYSSRFLEFGELEEDVYAKLVWTEDYYGVLIDYSGNRFCGAESCALFVVNGKSPVNAKVPGYGDYDDARNFVASGRLYNEDGQYIRLIDIEQDSKLYVEWTETGSMVTVTFDPNNGEESWAVDFNGGELFYYSDNAVQRPGYRFLGWFEDGKRIPGDEGYPIIGNRVFRAEWESLVQNVIELIDNIGDVIFTNECKKKIEEARTAYDSLRPEDKLLISSGKLKMLTDAEQTYSELNRGDGKIEAISISLEGNSIPLLVGTSVNVQYSLFPKNSTDEITWTSSKPDVIEISNQGVITGKKKGKAIITATTESGKSASREFSVTDCPAELSLVTENTELEKEAGRRISVKVMISDPEGHAGGVINVKWPKESFAFISASAGEYFAVPLEEIRDTTNDEGVVIMFFDGSTEEKNVCAAECKEVASLVFEIKEDAAIGDHLFEFERSELFNAEADILSGVTGSHYPGSYEGISLSLIDPAATYRVTFDANGHGSAPEPLENVIFGSKISTPKSPSTDGYSFEGWYKDAVGKEQWDFSSDVVKRDITLYAKWTVNINTVYKIEHYQQDLTGGNYTLKETENCTGTTGEKTAAAARTYEGFVTRNFQQSTISPNGKTVVRIYYDRKTYVVKWKNGENTVEIDYGVRFGEKPQFNTYPDPVKKADVQYTYTFSGWSPAITEETVVTENVTYTAQFSTTTNTYTITWKNGDEVLETDEGVPYGTKPSFDGETPKKIGDAQYSYTFNGWDPAVTDTTIVEGNATYTAQFTPSVNTYTVTWKNGDDVLETDTKAPYGTKPEYNGSTPEKAEDARYTYTFSGWSPAITEETIVTENVTYTAQFSKTTNTYTVVWKNGDAVLETDENVLYGTKPVYDSAAPEKEADAQFTYTFNGWDPVLTDETTVAGDMTFQAQFSGILRTYDVTFDIQGHGGSVPAAQENIAYDKKITEPEALSETGYTFGGWFKESTCQNEWKFETDTVKGTTTLYAKWTINSHKVKYVYINTVPAGAPVIVEVTKDYGTTVREAEKPALAGYTLSDWTTMDVTVTAGSFDMPDKDVTFTAGWTANTNTPYKVEHYLQDAIGDGYTRKETEDHTGTTAQQTQAGAKEYEGFIVKEFSQESIAGDGTTVVKIYYDRKTFTVTWKNGETILKTDLKVRYGAKPVYTGAAPIKTATDQYEYPFIGWDPAITDTTVVTDDAEYSAQFSQRMREYNVTFDANGHGTAPAIIEGIVYGSTIKAPDAPSAKGYTFAGWYKEAGCSNAWNFEKDTVTGAVTLYAKWTANTNTPYKVEHYQQNVTGDGYTKKDTDDLTGTTGAATAAAAKTYTGFTTRTFEQGSIGADGDTVIKIYYDRDTFSVTWKNGDQTLKTEELRYQAVPFYRGDTPVKQADAQYTYAFNGWDPAPAALTASTTYQAKFTQSLRKYTVVFKDWDGSNISTQQVSYGSAAAAPSDPKRSGYSFTGWDKDFSKITGDLTVTAQYETSRSSSGGGGGGSSGGGGGGGSSGGGGGGGSSGGGGGGGGGGPTAKKPAAAGAGTFSKNWFADAAGVWRIKDKAGNIVTSAWLCDDAVAANGQNVWYLMNTDGTMLAAGLVQDKTGNYYSLETNHNGYFGMLRYKTGTYDGIYMEFSQKHDGTFGAITNQSAIDALKTKYGVTKFGVGNENCVYTKNF